MQLKYGHFRSAAIHGIEGVIIDIEVALLAGLPSFDIVGQGDSAIRESKNRIMAAIRNSGFAFPPSRVTASLAPAWIRKEGSAFDLPLALAILIASGQIPLHPMFRDSLPGAFGELGLDGQIRPIPGVFNRTAALLEAGLPRVIVPADNVAEARVSAGPAMQVTGVESLRACAILLAEGVEKADLSSNSTPQMPPERKSFPDISMIQGQAKAIRALTIAAAGWHHLLLLGSPGSGKTALAQTIPGILPDLSDEQAREVTRIHSAANQPVGRSGLVEERPFLSPHTSVTRYALTGGGNPPVPGLFSLAHLGVLFLDELTQMDSYVLDVLRLPIEEQVIHLARLRYHLVLPCDFLLVAAANPCRCGEYFEPGSRCTCSPPIIAKHLGKLRGPLLDRLDLAVEVRRPETDDLLKTVQQSACDPDRLSSALLKEQISRTWQIQQDRCRSLGRPAVLNGRFEDTELASSFLIPRQVLHLAGQAAERYQLSVRSYLKMLRVSRTIADLEQSQTVQASHLAEAFSYRVSLNLEGQP